MPDNTDRKNFALVALNAYRRKTHTDGATALRDLLTDLMHLAHFTHPATPDYFRQELDAARMHFNAELHDAMIAEKDGQP